MNTQWRATRENEMARVGPQTSICPLAVSGLYYKYSRIRSNALSQNDIRVVSGNRYDDRYVSGQWQNPYETKESFAISLPVRTIYDTQLSVMLNNDLWHTNQVSSVQSFSVNFKIVFIAFYYLI